MDTFSFHFPTCLLLLVLYLLPPHLPPLLFWTVTIAWGLDPGLDTFSAFFTQKLFIYLIWPCWVLVEACGTFQLGCCPRDLYLGIQTLSCEMPGLVPWAGIEPGPAVLRAWSLSHWTTRETPPFCSCCPWCWELLVVRTVAPVPVSCPAMPILSEDTILKVSPTLLSLPPPSAPRLLPFFSADAVTAAVSWLRMYLWSQTKRFRSLMCWEWILLWWVRIFHKTVKGWKKSKTVGCSQTLCGSTLLLLVILLGEKGDPGRGQYHLQLPQARRPEDPLMVSRTVPNFSWSTGRSGQNLGRIWTHES